MSGPFDLSVVVIDNYDSYTYNLVQAIAARVAAPPVVVRNDERTWREVEEGGFDCVVISPGPGTPARAADLGISADAVLEGSLPLLGVCLGHQAIAHLNGGRVGTSRRIVHGGRSRILHDGDELFEEVPSGFLAVRYHSLTVEELPPSLRPIAWSDEGELMALRHESLPQWGVQFHPESVGTHHGLRLLENFLALAARRRHAPPRQHAPRRRPHVHRRPPRLRLHVRAVTPCVDAETIYRACFAPAPASFWLDSSLHTGGLARFSFLGDASGPRSAVVRYSVAEGVTRVEREGGVEALRVPVLDHVEEQLAAARVESDAPFPFHGGYVGYLGYELKADLGAGAAHASLYPDALLLFVDRFVCVDHQANRLFLGAVDDDEARAEAWLAETAVRLEALEPHDAQPVRRGAVGPFVADLPPEEYLRAIAECQAELRRGESYELCLTTQLRAAAELDPLELYSVLRRVNPAPYAAFLRVGELAVLSSSPERFLRLDPDGVVETKPIKGTAPRSHDPAEDAALAAALLAEPKTVAENLMITDVLRNDLGRVAEPGSVEVPVFLGVESYATVHQLVSTIRARCRPGVGAVDCVRATFPGGSMTGAPRLRSMEILDRVEPLARGVYAGALGHLSLSGAADLAVAIRTLVLDGGELSLGVGGAITVDSDPSQELEEAQLKAQALLQSVEWATHAAEAALPPLV